MQQIHRLHPESRHVTTPTYAASYIFPLLLLICEVYRVGHWIALDGSDFSSFEEMRYGYESLLMLAAFAVQAVSEAAFFCIAWLGGRRNLLHRLTDMGFALFYSLAVLAFDYMLQVAF